VQSQQTPEKDDDEFVTESGLSTSSSQGMIRNDDDNVDNDHGKNDEPPKSVEVNGSIDVPSDEGEEGGGGYESLDFSELLQEADDTIRVVSSRQLNVGDSVGMNGAANDDDDDDDDDSDDDSDDDDDEEEDDDEYYDTESGNFQDSPFIAASSTMTVEQSSAASPSQITQSSNSTHTASNRAVVTRNFTNVSDQFSIDGNDDSSSMGDARVKKRGGWWNRLWGGAAAGRRTQSQRQERQARIDIGEDSELLYHRSNDVAEGERRHTIQNGVKAERLGENSFRVSVYLPQTAVRAAMESASNPELLRLWCGSVVAVFITNESGRDGDMRYREHDAEWIEATASLRSPGPRSSFHNICLTLKSYLGFETHGHIALHIERRRGQLGLTIYPLGGCEVIHTLEFTQIGQDVQVIDEVRVNPIVGSHDNDDDDGGSFFSQRSCCRRLCCSTAGMCLPNITRHMDQTMFSLEDLRQMVMYGEHTVNRSSIIKDDGGLTPLLGGPMI